MVKLSSLIHCVLHRPFTQRTTKQLQGEVRKLRLKITVSDQPHRATRPRREKLSRFCGLSGQLPWKFSFRNKQRKQTSQRIVVVVRSSVNRMWKVNERIHTSQGKDWFLTLRNLCHDRDTFLQEKERGRRRTNNCYRLCIALKLHLGRHSLQICRCSDRLYYQPFATGLQGKSVLRHRIIDMVAVIII